MAQPLHSQVYIQQKCMQEIATRMFPAALFVIAPNRKPTKCQLTVEWINNIVLYSHNGILNSNEKEQATSTHNSDEYHKYTTNWKKTDTKEWCGMISFV